LHDASTGGSWSSSDPSLATIDASTGLLTGVASGTLVITYGAGTTGCTARKTIIVNPISPIIGDTVVCQGQTTVLLDTSLGGTWTSSDMFVATASTAGSGMGLIYGAGAGTATITYTLPTGCRATQRMHVNPAPPAITGPSQICAGDCVTMTDASGGGTWSSSDGTIATATTTSATSGMICGISAGMVMISYNMAGCPATKAVTVNPLPSAIGGSTNLCIGNTSTLFNSVTGGTWSSSATGVATIGASTGIVTAIASGTTTVTYTLASGCTATTVITVNPSPSAIYGSTNVCVGYTTTLFDSTGAGTGTWSSSDPTIASVALYTGVVTGNSVGTATIIYTIGTGCTTYTTVHVNNMPAPIGGTPVVCQGLTTTLTDASAGGSWTSADPTIASVGSGTGVVTGVSAATVTITYSMGTGCSVTQDVLVNPAPSPIIGPTGACQSGSPVTLTDATVGGNWSSSDASIASIDASGNVTPATSASGAVTITYTLGSTGCYSTMGFTVNPTPAPIAGSPNVCLGGTTHLTDATSGGTWSSVDPSTASVVSTSGWVTGVAIGTTTIVYTSGPGCTTTMNITVQPLPGLHTITGGGNFCAGGTGVHIGLDGSTVGVNYLLYNGSSVATGPIAGTGSALDFGLVTVGGSYHVIAVSSLTTCSRTMTGTALVVVNPTVAPGVDITTGIGDTVCSGTLTTFTPVPTNGGSSPTYVWNINGTDVATAGSYSYTPANGDLVKVTMTSNAGCATPATASHTTTMTVWAQQLPSVSVAINPKDSVCLGDAATFTAVADYGGSAPTFIWSVNGSPAHTGPSYMMAPSNGDVIAVTMTSNYPCRLASTATSNPVTMTVIEPILPLVEIQANPGLHINRGQSDTLHAVILNDISNPTYQWLLNGTPIPGATTSTYVSDSFSYPHADSVTCAVHGSNACSMTGFGWAYVSVGTVGVGSVATQSDITVLPNPNKGEFTIKGTLGTNDEQVTIELTDMLGQVVYKEQVQTTGGKISKHVKMTGIANGIYLLSLRSETDSKVFHIVVEQ